MIAKIIILSLLGSSDDKEKEKIGVARPEGPPLRGFRYPVSGQGSRGNRMKHRCIRWLSEEPTPWYFGAEGRHRMNRWFKKGHRCIDVLCSRDVASRARVKSSAPVEPVKHRYIPWCNDVSCQEFNGYFGL